MALIKINDTALIESSVTIGEKINQLNDMKSRLNSIAGAISDSWQGASSAAYASVLHDFDSRTSEMMEILEAFKEYIEKSTTDFKEIDRKSANRIRNSF